MKTATMATVTLDGEYKVVYHFDKHQFQVTHKCYDPAKGRQTKRTIQWCPTLSVALLVITNAAVNIGR